jgi:hypothetical protein
MAKAFMKITVFISRYLLLNEVTQRCLGLGPSNERPVFALQDVTQCLSVVRLFERLSPNDTKRKSSSLQIQIIAA